MAPRLASTNATAVQLDYRNCGSSDRSGASSAAATTGGGIGAMNPVQAAMASGRIIPTPVSAAQSISGIQNTMTLDPSSQHVSSVLRRQVGLLAGKTAKRRLTELRNTSRLPRAHHDFLSDHEEHHPENDDEFDNLHRPMRLSWDEIFVEDMLGMGGFGSVCLVTCPKLRKQREREQRKAARQNSRQQNSQLGESFSHSNDDESLNASFAMTADDNSSFGGSMMLSYASTTTATGWTKQLDPNKYYACKSLSNKTIKQANVRGFVQAAADLVHEAFLLSHINPHPNIIRLYGIPDGKIETAFDCEDELGGSDLGYFLVLEALGGGILSDKIHDWKIKQGNRLREQQILKKRKEQQELQRLQRQMRLKQQHQHSNCGQILPPTSPTLESWLSSPGEQQKSHTGRRSTPHRSLSDPSNNPLYKLPTLEERLEIALQIASGMQHLHKHGIVFRDLKPHNVGLSVSYNNNNNNNTSANANNANNNPEPSQPPPANSPPQLTWRLFDFGLAREVFPTSTNSPRASGNKGGSYSHHTIAADPSVCYGKAGSLRYMAPETMGGRWLRSSRKNQSSNAGCFATFGSDVFSFAVTLWELVGLQNFDRRYDANPDEFESAVCDRGHRPSMEALDRAIEMDEDLIPVPNTAAEAAARRYRHNNIRELVHACWREDYRQRPDFEFIVETLKAMLPSEEHDEGTVIIDDDTVATDHVVGMDEIDSIVSGSKQRNLPPVPPFDSTSNHGAAAASEPSRNAFTQRGPSLSFRSAASRGSASAMSRRRQFMNKKNSKRSVSSRSLLSYHSMSTHSMALDDVFELENEGYPQHQQYPQDDQQDQETVDHQDVETYVDQQQQEEDYRVYQQQQQQQQERLQQQQQAQQQRYQEPDDDDLEEDEDQSMCQQSMTSLMNESVITIDNSKRDNSSRYLNYAAGYNDNDNNNNNNHYGEEQQQEHDAYYNEDNDTAYNTNDDDLSMSYQTTGRVAAIDDSMAVQSTVVHGNHGGVSVTSSSGDSSSTQPKWDNRNVVMRRSSLNSCVSNLTSLSDSHRYTNNSGSSKKKKSGRSDQSRNSH